MKVKTFGVVAFLTVALAFSACGKKNNRTQNVAKPVAKIAPVAPTNPGTTPIPPTASAPKSAIEGIWWTDCTERSNGDIYARLIKVNQDVLSFGEYKYSDMDTCLADDVNGSLGKLDANTSQYIGQFVTKFALVAIQDGVMTHRVDYLQQDGTVGLQWVLRLEGKKFLASKISFLTSRQTSDYNDDYFQY